MADGLRHEWISAHILRSIFDERVAALVEGVEPSKDDFVKMTTTRRAFSLNEIRDLPLRGVSSAYDAVKFLVATHHRIFGTLGGSGDVDDSNHVRMELLVEDTGHFLRPQKKELQKKNLLSAARALSRLENINKDKSVGEASHFWRGIAIISRAAMILADHHVSGRKFPITPSKDLPLANSKEK